MEFDFDLEDPAYETVKEVTEKVEKKEVKKVVEVVKDEPKKKIVSKEAKVEEKVEEKVEPVKVEAAPKDVNKDTKPKKNLLNIVVKTETPKD